MPTYPPGMSYTESRTAYKYPPLVPGVDTSAAPAVTTPALAGSGTAVTNATGVDVMAYISGGTLTALAVNGGTILSGTGLAASVYIPAGAALTPVYTGTPTMKWVAV